MDVIYDSFMVAVCVLLLITAAAILRSAFGRGGGEVGGWETSGAWRRLRAVARVTIAEGLRMKLAIVFIGLLVVTLPALFLMAKGDGTIKGRVQMFLGYSIGLTGFYLSLLTIFFSCRTLANEIATQQIVILATKPVPRWQILMGKWLGIMILDVMLVAFAMLFTYGGARWIVGNFERRLRDELANRGGLTVEQADDCIAAINDVRGPGGQGAASPIIPALAAALGRSNEQIIELLLKLPEPVRMDLRRLDELRRQVLTARAAVKPDPPDLSKSIDEYYAMLKKENRLPSGPEWPIERIRDSIRAVISGQFTTVPYLAYREWSMKGPAPKADDKFLLSIRYKIRVGGYARDLVLPNGLKFPENTFFPQWIIGDRKSPSHYIPNTEPEAVNAFHEIEVPNKVVEPDGTIRVTLVNQDPRHVDAIVPLEDGLEVLYRVGSFEENLVTAGLALLPSLGLLAALGLLLSTFCTFPVAVLVSLVLFGICSTRGLLSEALAMTPSLTPAHLSPREKVRRIATWGMFEAVSLGELDPAEMTLQGRHIGWPVLGEEALYVMVIRGGVLLFVGVLVFRRRELAAVIV